MSSFLSKTLKGDRYVWFVYIALIVISIIEMFSASSFLVSRSGSISAPIMRHIQFIAGGFVLMLIVQLIDFKYMRLGGYALWAISIVLLLYTLVAGVEQAGSSRFLNLAGFQFQPSELAKISLVIVIADQIERMQQRDYQMKYYWFVAAGIGITCLLIFFENLSTAALLFITTMTMMLIGEVSWKKLAATLGVVVVGLSIVLVIASVIPEEVYRESDNKIIGLFDRAYTWVARFENFAGGEEVDKYKITDKNYQVAHAQIAIARGGFLPHMPGSSVQRDFLPEAFSDYIFAIIVEEGGFFMGVAVIILYLILLFRAYKVAQKSSSLFCAILVIGVSLLIVFQALMHVCVSVDMMPVTGQPLPLVSRGGTSMLINCLYFGVIISITRSIISADERKQREAAAAVVAVPTESQAAVARSVDDTIGNGTAAQPATGTSAADDDNLIIETECDTRQSSGADDDIITTIEQ